MVVSCNGRPSLEAGKLYWDIVGWRAGGQVSLAHGSVCKAAAALAVSLGTNTLQALLGGLPILPFSEKGSSGRLGWCLAAAQFLLADPPQ